MVNDKVMETWRMFETSVKFRLAIVWPIYKHYKLKELSSNCLKYKNGMVKTIERIWENSMLGHLYYKNTESYV